MKKEYKYSGLLALKLAWFYRYKKDSESEKRFLDIALQGFKNAYKKESFDSSFSLGKCCYIIAEIYIRLGDDTKAVRWYDIALRYCKFDGVQLQRQIRERWQEICERKRMIKDGVS